MRAEGFGEPVDGLAQLLEDRLTQLRLRIQRGVQHEAGEGVAARLSANDLECGLGKGANHVVDRGAPGGALRPVEQLEPSPGEGLEPARQNRTHQTLLRAEVVVDRRQVDAGLAGDRPQRGAGDALGGEEPLGGAQDRVLGAGSGGGV